MSVSGSDGATRSGIALALMAILVLAAGAAYFALGTGHASQTDSFSTGTKTPTTESSSPSSSSSSSLTSVSSSFATQSPTTTGNSVTTTTISVASAQQLPLCSGLFANESEANQLTMSRNVTTALYDTQFWLYFTKNTPTVQASVGATEMADSYGFGFSQIVNGLTDKGYWYQVGLAWNWWNFEGQGHYGGFEVFYQVWNSSNGQAVFPFTDGSTSPVAVPNTKEGDNVTLSLYISKGLVFMSAFDQRNGVSVTKNYTSDGATQFVSDPNSRFPTSLLTEWPHVLPYLCVNSAASFHMAGAVESGYLRIDEWNLTGVASNELFNPNIPGEFPIDTQLQPFSLQSADQSFLLSYDGMVEYASQVGFITM